MSRAAGHKIWIDLDNSPHVPFFVPIIRELERRNYQVFLTARDCFQVCGLADRAGLNYRKRGRHFGKRRVLKAAGTLMRALRLAPIVVREWPTLAVSHGSRAQRILASVLGIPNELGQNMVDAARGLIRRGLERRSRAERWAEEAAAFLGNRPTKENTATLTVNQECRPYHLGWLLYAFAA